MPFWVSSSEMKAKAKELDEELKSVEEQFNLLMLGLPNLPDTDLKDFISRPSPIEGKVDLWEPIDG